jgi:hypothetical protein
MAYEDDPPEFTGTEPQVKADPKGNARLKTGTPAVYNRPAKGEAHPKIARKAVADRLNDAEQALNLAQLELQAAAANLRSCEAIEAAAESAFVRAMPAPSQDQVHREMLAKETASKLARVSRGLPAVEAPKITARSPVDIAAANRPRASAQQPTAPLRSTVARRIV